jgi:hypothetical protein
MASTLVASGQYAAFTQKPLFVIHNIYTTMKILAIQ